MKNDYTLEHTDPLTASSTAISRAQLKDPLAERIRLVGSKLQATLTPVIDRVHSGRVRPIEIVRLLAVDPSTAGRLVRGLYASDPMLAARELPAPEGLGMILAAAQKLGVSEDRIGAAQAAVAAYAELLSEFPSGRAALVTAIDGWISSSRPRADRAAKHLIYKSMSQVLGLCADACYAAELVLPSQSKHFCDSISIQSRHGLRRLRSGGGFVIAAQGHAHFANERPEQFDSTSQQVQSLDGEPEPIDHRKFLIPDFGDAPSSCFRSHVRASSTRLILDRDQPLVNVPITFALGILTRNAYQLTSGAPATTQYSLQVQRFPTRLLILDYWIHAAVFNGRAPEIIARLHGSAYDGLTRDDELIALDRLDMNYTLEPLGQGFARTSVAEAPGLAELLEQSTQRAGLSPEEFHGFRCRIDYPTPFVELSTWFDLLRKS